MKRGRSHRRRRRRDADRKTRASSKAIKRWFRLIEKVAPLEVIFAPLALLCGVPPR